jgi:hypothetical protein
MEESVLKKRRINSILPLILIGILLVTTTLQVPVKATTIWSDDFNDGVPDGWTFRGWNITQVSVNEVPANYTLEDGNLRYIGEYSTFSYHASTVTMGTWSFDVDCVDTLRNHTYVAFMSDGMYANLTTESPVVPAEYGIFIATSTFGAFDNEFVLYRRDAGSLDLSRVIGRYSVSDLSGWYHIDVTRDSTGYFQVSINGTPRIGGTDNQLDSSSYFAFGGGSGPAIDNIVVTDVVGTSSTTTTESEPTTPPDFTGILLIGGAAAVVVIVVIAVVFLKRK